jgi:hypothetical protein
LFAIDESLDGGESARSRPASLHGQGGTARPGSRLIEVERKGLRSRRGEHRIALGPAWTCRVAPRRDPAATALILDTQS